MKIVRIFGIVLATHVVMLLVIFQPGCQSRPRPDAEATAASRTGGPDQPLEWEEQDQWSQTAERQRSAPTRPREDTSRSRSGDFDPLSPLPRQQEGERSASRGEQESSAGVYTVQRGDSLWTIAQRHNVTLNALLSINDLSQNSVIRPGQELLIPSGGGSRPSGSASTSKPPEGTTTYTVQRGDSLSVIAQRHGTTVSDLKDLNGLSRDVIQVGQKLIVPEGRGGRSSSSSGSSGSRSSSRSSTASAGDGERHVVKAGETPGGIAGQYGISLDELMSANNMSDPRRLQIGQELVIPGTGSGQNGSRERDRERRRDREREPEPEPEPEPDDFPVIPSEEVEEEFPIIPIIPDEQ